jgi:uncharacterized protein YdbL (DUF1318 family)
MPNTAIGVALWAIGLAAEIITGFSNGNTAEKAGAVGDLLDIAVGIGLSLSASHTLAKEINSYKTSSGNPISKNDLIKLQDYLENAKKVTAGKVLQGIIENFDRANNLINGANKLID